MKIPVKKRTLILLIISGAVFFTLLAVTAFGNGKKTLAVPPSKPIVKDGGERIEFKEGAPGLDIIKAVQIGNSAEFVTVEAPARLIASTAPSVNNGERIILFESAELNDLYVGYVHSRNQLNRSRKNLDRIRDMFSHRVATQKDVIEAETEADNNAADLAEYEGKLRAVGMNPYLISQAEANIAWIISDVPESQLQSMRKGKRVKVKFASYPNEEWSGTAEALGDNVDPTTRTVKVRIAIKNSHYKLKPGMFATVKFPEDTRADTVVIPFNSVVTVEGKNYVFVEETPGEFFRREVVLGTSGDEKVSVVEGLTRGEKVVVQGAILLKGLSFGF
ncbi:efflux transporter periplasmic adaptor subunit [Leptospira perolatii]|uniref:Efflux transporter periplasmic adaptor subunit n=1 Tax=Leptospira perolatii TaxID=2023191 RepID=A0A2M9ZMH5_9LEPT|nr:efflux RND transporter periplasmic adaptor subunit [Leptospira perolatii]PJZ70094.1 efflux transporter periplasmic adaptor subunit [Leptospira perolatii]PJZ73282.1 efflux transporter periplasmic adaptor subunit [Leptospira perolatii]